jgi:hypothetical protein
MDANLRSVLARPAEEAEVGETAPSFEEFYEASFRRLLPALSLISGNRFEAEEVAQEAFVRVFERWDRVGMLEDPTGYLFRVSMNVFRSRYRRASLAVRRAFLLAPTETDDLAAVETHDAVVRLLLGLEPEPCRRRDLDGTYGRDFDRLSAEVLGPANDALVRSLEPDELRHARSRARSPHFFVKRPRLPR